MFDKRLLVEVNQCPFTSLETKLKCVFPTVKVYKDQHNRIRLVAYNGLQAISGLFLDSEGRKYSYTVKGMYTAPKWRRQGVMRQLYSVAHIMFKSVAFDENLTKDGKKFALAVDGWV